MTFRAIKILGEVALVAAEDTRTTRKLLNRYNIKVRMMSLNDHNLQKNTPAILEILKNEDVALVSEAGTPSISDPGSTLVAVVRNAGYNIVPLPGASAVTTALSASGLSGQSFLFLGFLPRGNKDRRTFLEDAASSRHTLVIYESPRRILHTLEELIDILGDRQIAVGRELTKIHEEIFSGSMSQALLHLTNPRGEFTLVINGRDSTPVEPNDLNISKELLRLRADGARAKDAVAEVSFAMNLPKNYVYKRWLKLNEIG